MSELRLRVCAAHGVETRVECVSCGAPICLRCQVETDGGLECLSCAAKAGVVAPAAPAPVAAPARPESVRPGHRRRPPRPAMALALGALLLVASVAALRAAVGPGKGSAAAPIGRWDAGPELTALRGPTVAVKLADGRVLAVGGGIGSIPLAGTEVYDPTVARWARTADLHQARRGHAAVTLPDGRVLVAGGLAGDQVLSSAEVYDPATATWTVAGDLHDPRFSATLTVLGDGRALAAGGTGTDGRSLASAEVFDPRAGTWARIATGMTTARSGAAAAALRDGRVLIAGGVDVTADGASVLASAELFDPVADVFTRTGSLRDPREDLTATRLADGRVLAAGGSTDAASLAGAEIFDPARGVWTPTGAMATSRRLHGAGLLADGRVLVSAGETLQGGTRTSLATAEVFDPVTGRWEATGPMACPRRAAAQVTLDDGTVLVVGGDVAIPAQPSAAQSCVERFTAPARAGRAGAVS